MSQVNQLTLTALAASNMIQELRSVRESLLDTITDIYHGRFNFHLLSPEQLRNELGIIASQISKELALPIENILATLESIYHLLTIKARICEEYLLFEIKVPLNSRDSFEIFHLIPVPTKINNSKMVNTILISKYVAINLAKDAYIVMGIDEISSCSQQNDKYICQLKKPVYHLSQDEKFRDFDNSKQQCKTVVDSCNNKWTELNDINKIDILLL
ncbi:unnamed protein product [Parnassius mnemosyne]|uniref:Uncharacterized protein n=1 Tax=Parnassius mnemosyne TaxID=213953 RepID=A0AAV1KLM9_9NEOP